MLTFFTFKLSLSSQFHIILGTCQGHCKGMGKKSLLDLSTNDPTKLQLPICFSMTKMSLIYGIGL